jgi:RNA recognition motif-containing protein
MPAYPPEASYMYPQSMAHHSAQAAYPMQAASVDRTPCTVYITGIDRQLNEDSLIQVFNFCGTITNLRLCGDTSKPTRFAFIEFLTRESAAMALSFTGIMLGNSPLKVLPSKSAIQGPRPVSPAAVIMPALDPTYYERASRTLYVGSVDTRISPEELVKFFSQCGEVTKLCVAGDTIHAARFAFVEYSTAYEAHQALGLNGFVVGDRYHLALLREGLPLAHHHIKAHPC